jgi:hypothetical protein
MLGNIRVIQIAKDAVAVVRSVADATIILDSRVDRGDDPGRIHFKRQKRRAQGEGGSFHGLAIPAHHFLRSWQIPPSPKPPFGFV